MINYLHELEWDEKKVCDCKLYLHELEWDEKKVCDCKLLRRDKSDSCAR